MTKNQFVKLLDGADNGRSMDKWVHYSKTTIMDSSNIKTNESLLREMLCGIFDRIRQEEFKPGEDHVTQVQKVEADIIGKDKPVCYDYTNEENASNLID